MWWITVIVVLIVLAVLVVWVSRLPRGSSKSDRLESRRKADRHNADDPHKGFGGLGGFSG